MSLQLQKASLFSAFALVCLCLFARADNDDRVHFGGSNGPIVQILTQINGER
ncbi:MAG: hypothetical protein ABJ205_11230 [Erythrobacter sp.]|uniref:hypothetical protein n=1 Tax=Erythrobacter sp. TaxID=1042 RepID=UPI003267BFB8